MNRFASARVIEATVSAFIGCFYSGGEGPPLELELPPVCAVCTSLVVRGAVDCLVSIARVRQIPSNVL